MSADEQKPRSGDRVSSGTRIKVAAQSALGDLIVRHLTKIVLGICAIIGFVWNASAETKSLENRIERLEEKAVELRTDVDKVDKRVDRVWYRVGRRPPIAPFSEDKAP